MATPKPDKNNSKKTATKQITIAAFQRYMRSLDPESPTSITFPTTLSASPPPTTMAQGTYSLEVQDSSPSSPSAITPTPISDPGDLWSEHAVHTNHHHQVRKNKNFNIIARRTCNVALLLCNATAQLLEASLG